MPVRIKMLAGNHSLHLRGFPFLSDFDCVTGSPVLCDDPQNRSYGIITTGNVLSAGSGWFLENNQEKMNASKNGNSFIFLGDSHIPATNFLLY